MTHHFKKHLFAQTQGTTQVVDFNNIRRTAFTLAEVLITLGIIGVVAALTMPGLIANYRERVLVTAAKKAYSTITNALNMWNAQNDVVGNYEYFWISHENTEDLLKELSTLLNAVKVCTSQNLDECGGYYQVKTAKKTNDGLGNTATQNIMNYTGRAILADGSFIAILSQVKNGSCTYTFWANDTDENGNYIPTTDPSSPNGYQGK